MGMIRCDHRRRMRTGSPSTATSTIISQNRKGSTAHSNNPGVLNQIPHSWRAYIKSAPLIVESLAVSMTNMPAKFVGSVHVIKINVEIENGAMIVNIKPACQKPFLIMSGFDFIQADHPLSTQGLFVYQRSRYPLAADGRFVPSTNPDTGRKGIQWAALLKLIFND